MKQLIKKLVLDFGYRLEKYVPPPPIASLSAIDEEIIRRGKQLVSKFSPDLSVLDGPFVGLKYPSLDITELALAPKIFGTYEKQLHPFINNIVSGQYVDILDVGSAEGYYAVGMARLMPETMIHCYDINTDDMKFCAEMAKLNKVSNITYHSFCSPQTLVDFNFTGRSLVFCDCEGYELELLTPRVVAALEKVDVLVELHDLIDSSISETLVGRFGRTHEISIVDNGYKATEFLDNKSLTPLNPSDRAFATCEHRGGCYQNRFMEWAYIKARNTWV